MPSNIPFGYGIPFATGGTYISSGPPVWWSTTAAPPATQDTSLEDPRWVFSSRIGYPDTSGVATDQMFFRALHYNEGAVKYLLLSWVVRVDPNVGSTGDNVLVGFFKPGATQAVALRVIPAATAMLEEAAAPAQLDLLLGSVSGGTWSWASDAQRPVWLDKALVWVDNSAGRRFPWAVQMRIPLSTGGLGSGLDLDPDFRMRFQVNVAAPNVQTIVYKWPRAASTVLGNNLGDPTSGNWDPVHVGDGPGGITIDWPDVGTLKSDSGTILYAATAASTPPVNQFYCRPYNQSTTTVPASTSTVLNLSARFRIADWGSQPDSAGNWVDIPQGSDVRNITDPVVAGSGAIAPAAHGEMRFPWTVQEPLLTDFRTGTRRDHQCMLVELRGPGLQFTKSSVYRNMHVAGASTVVREPEISVVGLAPLSGTTDRDVYLYVQTLNMPTSLFPPAVGRGQKPEGGRDVAIGRQARGRAGIEEGDDDGNGNGDDVARPPEPPEPVPWENETRPVYLVHVWHTTGEKYTDLDATQRDVLEAQTSFGLYVEHDGPLFGWSNKLTGPGLQKIAPDFYKVKVPNNGSVHLRTEIEAHETPTGFLAILRWLLILLWALVLWLLGLIPKAIDALKKLFGSP